MSPYDMCTSCAQAASVLLILPAAAAILSIMGKIKACAAHKDESRALQYATPATTELCKQSEAPRLGVQQASSCRALCIGLGGGTLPNFLSHHFPGLHVDAVELDPVVIAAATECMGLSRSRCCTFSCHSMSCVQAACQPDDAV